MHSLWPSLNILCLMQIKAGQMKQVPGSAVRIFYTIQCMQNAVGADNKFLVRLLSNTLQYRKNTMKKMLEGISGKQEMVTDVCVANVCCAAKDRKLSGTAFSAVM